MSRVRRSKFLGATTVGERGQIVIPAEARKALGINSGDKLVVFSRHRNTGLMLLKADVVNKLVSDAWEQASDLEKLLDMVQTTEETETEDRD